MGDHGSIRCDHVIRGAALLCGVTGWIDFDRDLRNHAGTLRAMTDTMIRRGPDSGDIWLSEHVAFGHRRLAVIDVDGGVQPMVVRDENGDVRIVITYSGEVYNFRELRAELTALGHRFTTTRSDTEVVLHAHLEWGAAAVERLNGMYAYAVWDARAEEVLLVRDRLGVKPLYYAPAGGRLLFGSEPKAVLANPLFSPELDSEGIAELFAVPTAPTPGHAIYRGLHEVRPGHLVRFARTGLHSIRYWELRSTDHHDTPVKTVAHVRELLNDIVHRQLVSDVPLGLMLSGGLDSSTLTALAVTQGAKETGKIATFSVGFPPSEPPERLGAWNVADDEPYIREFVAELSTVHTSVVVPGAGLLAHRGIGLEARDRPGWGEPDTSLHLLFGGVREHVTVALSGEGADEIFGGYPYFHNSDGPLNEFPWSRRRSSPAELLRDDVADVVRPREYAHGRLQDALAEVPRLPDEDEFDRRKREISYLALTRWLPALLDRTDRMSMAAGLEVRVPFADHRLVEYLWNVPWRLKAEGGTPKALLRRAVADLLPDRVLNRPKSGYPASSAADYRVALHNEVEELLRQDGPVFQLVDRAKIRRFLDNGELLPGSRAAPHPTGGLDYLLAVNTWLGSYRVHIK
ncbi:asparagine synthase (glutamine-hydrolyzing) [Nocardia sp. NPDC060256]|uniref:asparagine synthase (glutamine-hydrolyzing) n=1 Tax=unclassified Nocardia TaxID=2637762 RepID=UPI003659A802